jgi:hypothetical protein
MDLEHLVPAMFGNLAYVAPFNPITGVAGEFELELGRDGNLRTNHPYISAVMSLRQVDLRHEAYREWSDKRAEQRRLAGIERTFDDVVEQFDADARSWEEHCEAHEVPNGVDFRADVLVIESPFAATLPDSFFNGAGDRRTVVIREVIQPE